jgi:two-component system sensor histidine kinase KdpD
MSPPERREGPRHRQTGGRLLVVIDGLRRDEPVIRRAAQLCEATDSDLVGVHIRSVDLRVDASSDVLEESRQLLERLGGTYHEVVASDGADALIRFARDEGATGLVLATPHGRRAGSVGRRSFVKAVLGRAAAIDFHLVHTGEANLSPAPAHRRPRPQLSKRRQLAGFAIATAGTATLTLLFASARGSVHQPSRFLLYQLLVLVAAAVGGAGPAVTTALLSATALNWLFTPPFYTWSIEAPENVLALVVFTIVGLLVGLLVTGFARRSAAAERARNEAEALARIAAGLVGEEDPVPPMLDRIRTTLGLDGVAVYAAGTDTMLAAAGDIGGRVVTNIDLPGGRFVFAGPLSSDDRTVVQAFAAQLAAALDRRRLREEAASAAALAEADALRTALLRAVSHDLRTPLASIKASVTSLLQSDVTWSPDEGKEFLLTIDEEADRLDHLVADLLDASRLEAGAVSADMRPVALDEVVPAALATISGLETAIAVRVPETLPLLLADRVLLERALANLVANAARASPPGAHVGIAARHLGDTVEIRISDRGPGVPAEQRERMFDPFHRVGDASSAGVGLGLAVAKGMIDAMGGTVEPEETAGGGLTMVVTVAVAGDAA